MPPTQRRLFHFQAPRGDMFLGWPLGSLVGGGAVQIGGNAASSTPTVYTLVVRRWLLPWCRETLHIASCSVEKRPKVFPRQSNTRSVSRVCWVSWGRYASHDTVSAVVKRRCTVYVSQQGADDPRRRGTWRRPSRACRS